MAKLSYFIEKRTMEEIGRCANFGKIRKLIEFYGKKMTIKFE